MERNGANPGDGSESMTDLSNIGSNMRTKIDREDAKEISPAKGSSTIFHYGTSIGLRKEKFQSRINPPANGRTKRIDRAKPIRTSTLQLDASERTEMLWPGIGRVIT